MVTTPSCRQTERVDSLQFQVRMHPHFRRPYMDHQHKLCLEGTTVDLLPQETQDSQPATAAAMSRNTGKLGLDPDAYAVHRAGSD